MSIEKISNRQFATILFMMRVTIVLSLLPLLTTGEARQDAWAAAIITAVGLALEVLLIGGLGVRYPHLTVVEYSRKLLGGVVGTAVSAVILWQLVHMAATDVRVYAELMASGYLPETPMVVIVGGFLAVAALTAYLGIESVGRTADALVPLYVLFIVATIVGALSKFDVGNLEPVLSRGWGPVLSSAATPVGIGAQLLTLGVVIPNLTMPERAVRSALLAITFAGLTFILASITIVGVLGPELGAQASFPFLEVARMIVIARAIARIEALGIFAWGVGLLVGSSLMLYCSCRALAQLLGLADYRPVVSPLAAIVAIHSVHGYRDLFSVTAFFRPPGFPLYIASVMLIPYGLLWAGHLIRAARQARDRKSGGRAG